DLEIFDVAIKKNASVSHGGGIYVCDTVGTNKIDGTITVHNGVFSENTSNFGAGITLYSGATGVINNAVISKNKVFDTAGGILVYNNSNLTINYVTITENEVTYQYNNNSGAAGILLGINSVLTINDGIIENNKCISDGVLGEYLEGGGIKIGGGSSFNVLNIKGGIIRNNVALTNGGGIYDKTGVSEINISGNAQIYGNTANGEESDIHINKGRSININGKLGDTAHIGIRLAGDYGEEVFTNGYSTYNTEKPSAYFFSSNERGKIASINNVEVKLVQTINTDTYEFVYMEEKNGKTYRQKYTDNELIHGVNDYKCNVGGNYILGNVMPYTSVNEFVGNLNIDTRKIKVYNSNGYLIYDKGGVASGLNSNILDNKYNLSVGTGWVLEVIDSTNKVVESIKISVLGDISGDGRVNSVDITNMRSFIGNTEKYNKLTEAQKLASLVDNKGSISVVDIEILKAYI
ncbi:MAG: hypothetical protein K2P12_04490, partial [Clostridia bacterium]|nr:hypothetical protein [Clostridia bacterium]